MAGFPFGATKRVGGSNFGAGKNRQWGFSFLERQGLFWASWIGNRVPPKAPQPGFVGLGVPGAKKKARVGGPKGGEPIAFWFDPGGAKLCFDPFRSGGGGPGVPLLKKKGPLFWPRRKVLPLGKGWWEKPGLVTWGGFGQRENCPSLAPPVWRKTPGGGGKTGWEGRGVIVKAGSPGPDPWKKGDINFLAAPNIVGEGIFTQNPPRGNRGETQRIRCQKKALFKKKKTVRRGQHDRTPPR